MRTVPLYGKKAAGRMTRVDDGDYDLAMRHRWHVRETVAAGKRPDGPYACTKINEGGVLVIVRMHTLLTGWPRVDHADHDGLNNQRYNLRNATASQNSANSRPQEGRSSAYKGVTWDERHAKWQARVIVNGSVRHLGRFVPELEAAYAYDAAAREAFGLFACTNFSDEPGQAMRDQWRAAREVRAEDGFAVRQRTSIANMTAYWDQREPETRTCEVCGAKYQSMATQSRYCGEPCKWRARRRRQMQREQG